MSFSQPFLLSMSPGILKNPKGEDHPLVINKSLALVTWKATVKLWLSQAFQNKLPVSPFTHRDKVHQLIKTHPEKNGVTGVTGKG